MTCQTDKIAGDTLLFTKGDTFEFCFQRKNKNKEVITTKPDKMYFSVKEDINSKDVLFQKRLSDSTISYNEETYYYNITIDPSDTDNLNLGDYYYDIEIIDNNKVKTIKKGIISLTYQITDKDNEV